MTIEIKSKGTLGPLTIEREFRWDALDGLSRLLLSPLALIARLGEADRVDEQERERRTKTR